MPTLNIATPTLSQLPKITTILSQWTEIEEVNKYITRITNEINGQTQYNLYFFVGIIDNQVVGITGISDPLPLAKSFAQTPNPAELKILYIDGACHGQGFGRQLLEFIQFLASNQEHTELLIRSANRYRGTAYGFYEKMGYTKLTILNPDTSNSMQLFSKLLPI